MGVVGALATVAAACGGSSHVSASGGAGTGGATTAGAVPTTNGAASLPKTPSTSVLAHTSAQYGRFLTTATGFALYTYTADEPGGPGCSGQCLKIWPPLLLAPGQTAPMAAAGVAGLGTFHRGSRLQVTFHGLPLYTFVKDKAPGQVTGQDFVDSGGKWILAVVSAPAAPTTAPPMTAAPTTAPAGSAPPATAPATTAPPTTAPANTAPPTTAPSSGGASF